MSQKFHGTIEELKNVVLSAGIPGEWESYGNKQTFRSEDGGILSWWPTGTIQFQGKADEKANLERMVLNAISTEQSHTEPDKASQEGPVPDEPKRTHSKSLKKSCCESAKMLKRVKRALSRLGITILLINDSVKVMTMETEYGFYNSLDEYGPEIHIRKL